MKHFLMGIVLTLLIIFLGGFIFISLGLMPANADSKPGNLERWMAHKSLKATIERDAPKGKVPIPMSDENLIAGIRLYSINCAVCHGASDGKPSNIAVGLFQKAPQLSKHGVEDDPEGETFWKIKHGIRLTGMPAFSKTMNDVQIWQMVLLLKHMDTLGPNTQKVWLSVPSAKP